jgi:PST family polysaccharide transporter
VLKLLKVVATTGGASAVTLLLGLATNKIIAVVLGPMGVGLLASYRAVQDTVTGLGSLGGAAAQVQALSSVEGEARRRRVIACIWLAMIGVAIFSVLLLAGAPLIAEHFFRDPSPEIVTAVRCLVVTFCVSIGAFLASGFINVSGAIGWLALVQIAASIMAVAAAWPLATLAARGSQLAYVGLILTPLAVQFALAAFMTWRLGWLPDVANAFRQRPARADVAHFLAYFVANVGGGLLNSASLLTLRASIIDTDGQAANGLFQASWTLTQQNLTLLMASFGTYLLPTLSATHDAVERQRFLDDTLPVIIVLTVPLAGVGLLFMPLILRLLYSTAFLPAIEPLRWMLLANLFSALVAAFVILLMARGRPMASAVTEVGWYAGFAGAGVAVMTGVVDPGWVGLGRLEALGAAFFVLHGLRLACLIAFCRNAVSYFPAPPVWRIGAIGFGLLLVAAWIGWSAREVNWAHSLAVGAVICATPLLLLNRQRLDRLRSLLRARIG